MTMRPPSNAWGGVRTWEHRSRWEYVARRGILIMFGGLALGSLMGVVPGDRAGTLRDRSVILVSL